MDIKVNGKWIKVPTGHESFLEARNELERVRPVNISLSIKDIERLDAIKVKTGSSRSALIRVAINMLEELTK